MSAAPRDLVELEQELWRGRSADVLERHHPIDPATVGPHLGLILGIAAKEEDRFRLAALLLTRALEDERTRGRAVAHLAHLDYYSGDFGAGIRRAAPVLRDPDPLVRAEAALYTSVNAIALDDADQAVASAVKARNLAMRIKPAALRQDLRFRVARQLVHVYVAAGKYVEAARESEAASAIATRLAARRMLATAAYLRGYAHAARGDPAALALFAEADRLYGGPTHWLGRWVRFVWAMLLRDLGDLEFAGRLRESSGISIPWEDPLFDLAATGHADPPSIDGARADEVPFRLGTAGLIALVGRDLSRATQLLATATDHFARTGLEHYRRGCALALAATHDLKGDRASALEIVTREMPAIQQARLTRWPWWHPLVAQSVAALGARDDLHSRSLAVSSASRAPVEVGVGDVLAAIGLTEREAEVVTHWIDHPEWTRAQLARSLGMSEASVRNHLNSARRALQCDARRGPEPLRERVEELRYRPRRGLV